MFQIQIIATGSKGNAYAIRDGDETILIDPGIPIKEIQKALNFGVSRLKFCLVSHEHQDHCKAVKDIMGLGVPCAMSAGTLNAIGPDNFASLPLILNSRKPAIFESWTVLPFDLVHDAAEPLGFLIQSPTGKKICFATDTARIDFDFSGVTHWLVEANYSEELLTESTRPETVKDRIRASHMSIENLCEFFKRQDLSATEEIYLIHLSDNNSDEKLFKKIIEKTTGKPLYDNR